jgi:histidine ammonia-lyase
MQDAIALGLDALSRADVLAIARQDAPIELTPASRAAVEAARAHIEDLAGAETPTYGISTGFGALATRHIPPERRAQLQRSLIRSHAAGAGDHIERAEDPGQRPHRRSSIHSGHDDRDAERGHRARRARVRLTRLLR